MEEAKGSERETGSQVYFKGEDRISSPFTSILQVRERVYLYVASIHIGFKVDEKSEIF